MTLVIFAAALVAADAHSDVTLAIFPDYTLVAPGEEFTVEIAVAEAGDPINGYDAVVGFDPLRLELLLPVPRSAGERALFTDACPQRFLNVAVAGDSTQVTVSHVLLCAGATVTGPGETYRLRFRARGITGPTALTLLGGTAAYDAGNYVEPLVTRDAQIWIGVGSSSPPAPGALRLMAVPNPFNPRTELRCELDRERRVRLDVFDAAGRRIDTLFDGWAPPGSFRIHWDGRDRHGRPLASGVYLARLTTPAGTLAVARMVLVR